MSLITRMKGDVKNGKTAAGVWWSQSMAAHLGLSADQIFTNLKGCYDHEEACARCKGKGQVNDQACSMCKGSGESPTYNQRWATTVSINDVIIDMAIDDPADAEIKDGLFFWDEAQGMLSTSATRGPAGNVINNVVNQCGKRGLPLVLTTHLDMMLNPTVRGLIMVDMLCIRKKMYPNTIILKIMDQRAARLAYIQGLMPPMPDNRLLKHINRIYRWYETNEVESPMSFAKSAGSTKSMDKFATRLGNMAAEQGIDLGLPQNDPKPETKADRIEAERQVRQAAIAARSREAQDEAQDEAPDLYANMPGQQNRRK